MPISSEVIAILSEVIAISYPNFRRKGHFFRNLSFDKKKYYRISKNKIYNSNELLFLTKRARTHTRERFFFFFEASPFGK